MAAILELPKMHLHIVAVQVKTLHFNMFVFYIKYVHTDLSCENAHDE